MPHVIECTTSDTEHEAMKEWLKYNVEPPSQVKNYMEKTAIKRAAWIRENTGLSIGAVLKEYPRLFDTPGMVNVYYWHCCTACWMYIKYAISF